MKLSEKIRRNPHIVDQQTQHKWADEVAKLEEENAVLRNAISLLKNENERMMKLAHDYIAAYEKLAFEEEQGDQN